MRVLAIIPARGGSKGVPGKNIKLLSGKPLIEYTTQVALQSKLLTKVLVSSDDDKIIEVAKNTGVEVPFKRPSNLSEDATPTLPVIVASPPATVSIDAGALVPIPTLAPNVAPLDV